MKLSSTWRKRLIIAIYTLIGLTVVVAAFTLVKWIQAEDNYEPFYVLAILALLGLTLAANRLRQEGKSADAVEISVEDIPLEKRLNVRPLLGQIHSTFNLEELQRMCFELSIEYEDLPGTTRQAKVVSLVKYALRHNRLSDLLEALHTARPHIDWHHPVTFTAQELRIRRQVLNNVYTTWIEGFLHRSLHHEVLKLTFTERQDAVNRTWGILLKQPNQPDLPLAKDKSVRKVFNDYGGSLLILGEPGSGKTITLLQLADQLIADAQERPTHQVTIILNLSSWAQKEQTLTTWLIEEIFLQYQLSRRIALEWIKQGRFIYLLDGLDEVAAAHRDACVEAINNFLAQYPANLVVCSRSQDYEELQVRLNMAAALSIQPLADEEVLRYLQQPGIEMQAVRATLQTDPDLQELTRSPLMLSIMSLAYRGLDYPALQPLESIEARRKHIFQHYVSQMLELRPLSSEVGYDESKALKWLTNLAKSLTAQKQTVFYLERLQPIMLSPALRRQYKALNVLLCGLIPGMIIGVLYMGFGDGIVTGAIFGGVIWASISIVLLTLYDEYSKIHLVENFNLSFQRLRKEIFSGLNSGGIVGLQLLFGLLIFWFIYKVLNEHTQRRIIAGFNNFLLDGVQEVEGTSFEFLGEHLAGMVGTQNYMLAVFIIYSTSLIMGLVLGIILGLGNLTRTSEASQRLQPNQGIYKSLRNAIQIGLIFGIVGAIIYAGIFRLATLSTMEVMGMSLVTGFIAGFLFAFFRYGGLTFLSHYILRYTLEYHHILPFALKDQALVDFLDSMGKRILLRRVGGGWIFAHRYLLEHFADGYALSEEARIKDGYVIND